MSRVRFPDISSRAWEHPADRAALQSLRKVPGFDLAVRRIMSLVSERPIRVITTGSAVEVGPEQFPRVDRIYGEVLDTLDAPRRYDLFVTHNPVINAGAVGMDDPFIVLNSATVQTLADEQLRGVLAHEVAHIMSDHVLYKTMLRVVLRMGVVVLRIPLAGIPLLAVTAALLEWDRKSELSADRAMLLAVQDPDECRATLLRMAGGVGEGANIDAFRAQADRYEEEGGALDSVLKVLALLGRRHPFPVQRLKEIDRWVDSGAYQAILDGDYPKREDDAQDSTWDAWKESADGYREGFKGSKDPVTRWFREATEDVAEKAGKAFGWMRRGKKDGEEETSDEDADGVADASEDDDSPDDDQDDGRDPDAMDPEILFP